MKLSNAMPVDRGRRPTRLLLPLSLSLLSLSPEPVNFEPMAKWAIPEVYMGQMWNERKATATGVPCTSPIKTWESEIRWVSPEKMKNFPKNGWAFLQPLKKHSEKRVGGYEIKKYFEKRLGFFWKFKKLFEQPG